MYCTYQIDYPEPTSDSTTQRRLLNMHLMSKSSIEAKFTQSNWQIVQEYFNNLYC